MSYCHSTLFAFSTPSPEPLDGYLGRNEVPWPLTSVVVFRKDLSRSEGVGPEREKLNRRWALPLNVLLPLGNYRNTAEISLNATLNNIKRTNYM